VMKGSLKVSRASGLIAVERSTEFYASNRTKRVDEERAFKCSTLSKAVSLHLIVS
jgi:hypothetical protein